VVATEIWLQQAMWKSYATTSTRLPIIRKVSTMAIWEITFDADTFQHLIPLKPANLEWIDLFQGSLIGTSWINVYVVVSNLNDKQIGDFPSIGGVPPIFNDRALNILLPLIYNDIEFLPLQCDTSILHAINIIKVVDCLDYNTSKLKLFPDGRVMRIEKYGFKKDCLKDVHLFKIPEQIKNRHYVSDEFKHMVETNHLKGMLFHQVA
jgi:hypothetical protein